MNETELMLTAVLDCRRVDLAIEKRALTSDQRSRYDRMRARRAKGEPVQYIIGQCDFMGAPLAVDRRALIPRPETEILADLAIEKARSLSKDGNVRILDLGVGSGNITIALLKNIPEMTVTAVDICADALDLARENARVHHVERQVEFHCCDMTRYLQAAARRGERFDLIVSNPPYIPTRQISRLPEEVQYEPRVALDGGVDGLQFYRTIVNGGWKFLGEKGWLMMEIGDGQRDDIAMIFTRHPEYRSVRFYKDYVGTDRIVVARTTEDI